MPMTPAAMERQIRNLDRRAARIEQILPTLATKDDLTRFATRDELEEVRQDLRRHMLVLIEDVRGDIRLVAEAVADLSRRIRGGDNPA